MTLTSLCISDSPSQYVQLPSGADLIACFDKLTFRTNEQSEYSGPPNSISYLYSLICEMTRPKGTKSGRSGGDVEESMNYRGEHSPIVDGDTDSVVRTRL